jgi:hypothetical protein
VAQVGRADNVKELLLSGANFMATDGHRIHTFTHSPGISRNPRRCPPYPTHTSVPMLFCKKAEQEAESIGTEVCVGYGGQRLRFLHIPRLCVEVCPGGDQWATTFVPESNSASTLSALPTCAARRSGRHLYPVSTGFKEWGLSMYRERYVDSRLAAPDVG